MSKENLEQFMNQVEDSRRTTGRGRRQAECVWVLRRR